MNFHFLGVCFTKFFHGKNETIWITKMLSAAGYAVSDETEAFDLLSKFSTTEVARVFKTFHDTVVIFSSEFFIYQAKIICVENLLISYSPSIVEHKLKILSSFRT